MFSNAVNKYGIIHDEYIGDSLGFNFTGKFHDGYINRSDGWQKQGPDCRTTRIWVELHLRLGGALGMSRDLRRGSSLLLRLETTLEVVIG